MPFSNAFDQLRKPVPYYDDRGIRVPDVYDDKARISGINRYRALLAHVAAHKRWTKPIIADNYSPFQRVAIEMFEDSRVEHLAMQSYRDCAGCGPHCIRHREESAIRTRSRIRHRLAMLIRSALP